MCFAQPSRSSNPHLSRAKPAPSYLRASYRGRWMVSAGHRGSHQCSRTNFSYFFVSYPAIDPPFLRCFSTETTKRRRGRSILGVEGERSVQDRGNLKKSFGKDYEDQREREREEEEEEEEERISVQLERSVNTRIYASSRAGEKSGSDVIVGSQGRDEGAARHESRS